MYISFDGGQQDLCRTGVLTIDGRPTGFGSQSPLLFFLFDEGREHGHGFFHDAGAFYHLWQEHLAATKEISHHIHSIHQGAFDDIQWFGIFQTGLFRIGVDVFGDTVDEGMFQPLLHGALAPGFVFYF